jgi:hypothetical protein
VRQKQSHLLQEATQESDVLRETLTVCLTGARIMVGTTQLLKQPVPEASVYLAACVRERCADTISLFIIFYEKSFFAYLYYLRHAR